MVIDDNFYYSEHFSLIYKNLKINYSRKFTLNLR